MGRPVCPEHPGSRVWRDGRYGKHGQYQRWRCVPQGCTRSSPESHLFQPPLPRKALGGNDGSCLECERPWRPGEGLPSARTDRFSLLEKADALAHLARGATYREAARRVRRRALRRGAQISSDGRTTGDWVSIYAPIIQAEFLRSHPEFQKWPEVLVLDSAPFHGRTTYADGRPKPSGRHLFSVFGALSYDLGTVDCAHSPNRRPRVWRYGTYLRASVAAWVDFFSQLPGRPLYVVCDGDPTLLRAIDRYWPDIPVFRCTAHLSQQAMTLAQKAGVKETPFGKSLNEQTFTARRRWGWFRLGLSSLEEDGFVEGLNSRQRSNLKSFRTWAEEVACAVDFNLSHDHAPWSTGGLERPLRVVKKSLYDRRLALRNMDRLNHLLVLFQLDQLGMADPHWWAHVLHEQHLGHEGEPPPRRLVDKPELYPGFRGGRMPAPSA